MSEAKLWEDVRDGMTTRWHAQRHEDKYSKGIPDVSFGIGRKADGWVELKYLPAWPSGSRPWDFSFDHFTAEQRNWLEMRLRHGTGRVFMLCGFGPQGAAIWNWARLRDKLGLVAFDEILRASNAQWQHGIDYEELTNVLANNRIIAPRFRL